MCCQCYNNFKKSAVKLEKLNGIAVKAPLAELLHPVSGYLLKEAQVSYRRGTAIYVLIKGLEIQK